jgi:coenzyme F420 hydrogenase subunit delta
LIVVDAAYHQGVDPGTVRCCRAADLERTKAHDFSLHQFPTVNLLAELESETRMRVELLLAQAETLPDEVRPGLSPVMEEAVRRACTLILQRIAEDVIIFSTRDAVAIAEDGV